MGARNVAGITAMRDIIEELIEECGGTRPAARVVGTSHQNLMNWRDSDVKPTEINKFMEAMEKARVKLGIPKSKMWGRMIKGVIKER